MVPLINSKQIYRRKAADMCNTMLEKCSRRVQREVRDDVKSMPLTIKHVDQPLSENVEGESNNIIESLRLWCETLDKNTGKHKQQSSYVDVTGQLSPPIALNVYSFLSEIEGHPTYTGFEFNYYSLSNYKIIMYL